LCHRSPRTYPDPTIRPVAGPPPLSFRPGTLSSPDLAIRTRPREAGAGPAARVVLVHDTPSRRTSARPTGVTLEDALALGRARRRSVVRPRVVARRAPQRTLTVVELGRALSPSRGAAEREPGDHHPHRQSTHGDEHTASAAAGPPRVRNFAVGSSRAAMIPAGAATGKMAGRGCVCGDV
jgi:hypothetical protein